MPTDEIATRVILKSSPIPDATPAPAFLNLGELALNYADGKLYYKNNDGEIKFIGENLADLIGPGGGYESINEIKIENGELIIITSSGNEITAAGSPIGPTGPVGIQGPIGATGATGAIPAPPIQLTQQQVIRTIKGEWATTDDEISSNSEWIDLPITLIKNPSSGGSDEVWSTTGLHDSSGGPTIEEFYVVLERMNVWPLTIDGPHWRLFISYGNGGPLAIWRTEDTNELNIDNLPPFYPYQHDATGVPSISHEMPSVTAERVGQLAYLPSSEPPYRWWIAEEIDAWREINQDAITTSTHTNLNGFLRGNGANVDGATDATFLPTPNTLVLRDKFGSAHFRTNTDTIMAGPALIVSSVGSKNAIVASTTGSGLAGRFDSQNGTAVSSNSQSGTYHHVFGTNVMTSDRSAVERVRGWFVWFFGQFTGRLKTADITGNREWTLPDESGNLAIDRNTGRTIFVDGVTGNDTRGTLSQYSISTPFKTIGAAMAASAKGDTVRVRAGNYAITTMINLNDEGNLYFESGTTVNIANGITGFSFNQITNGMGSANSIRIKGNADFVLAGSAGILTMPTPTNISSPPIVDFECNSITGPNNASGTLFNIANGVLSVDAKAIVMTTTFTDSSARVFNITGSGRVTVRVPFVYCGVFLNGAGSVNDLNGNTTAQINTDIWTLITYNITAGMTIRRVTTNFRIVNYNHAGVGAALSWTENTTKESHVFRGITWSSLAGQSNITFASTAGLATNKIIRLDQTNIMRYATTNSIISNVTVPINVVTYGTFASVPATSNVTFKIGSFTVDADVNNY